MTEIINNGSGKIYFIGYEKLINNGLNSVYKVEDNDDVLKNSIERYGLKTPLTVVRAEENYKLIAGHRRLSVIKQIFAEGKTLKFGNRELTNQVPCIFENEYQDEDEEFLNVCSSNNYRKLSPEEVKPIVCKCAGILEKQLASGQVSLEGTTKRDLIAKMAGVSARTVDKYLKRDSQESDTNVKIKSVISVINTLEKYEEFVKELDLDEYGKTDRSSIKEELLNLSNICKKKK